MTRKEAVSRFMASTIDRHNKHDMIELGNEFIDWVYDDFEKELQKLKNNRDYWKLSFNKEVKAKRKEI